MTQSVEAPVTPALPTAAKLREFANDQGLTVGSRGRIPADVVEAFQKARKTVQKKYL